MVSNCLWYILHLWTGNFAALDSFDKMIRDFIWSGQDSGKRPKVDYLTLTLSKIEGGMGLIYVKTQTIAKAGTTILWTLQEGEHTLQSILRKKLGEDMELTIMHGCCPQIAPDLSKSLLLSETYA